MWHIFVVRFVFLKIICDVYLLYDADKNITQRTAISRIVGRG